MAARKLTLKKETLSTLTTENLRAVVGAASGMTCGPKACLNSDYNCAPTFEQSCLGTCYCTPTPPA